MRELLLLSPSCCPVFLDLLPQIRNFALPNLVLRAKSGEFIPQLILLAHVTLLSLGGFRPVTRYISRQTSNGFILFFEAIDLRSSEIVCRSSENRYQMIDFCGVVFISKSLQVEMPVICDRQNRSASLSHTCSVCIAPVFSRCTEARFASRR